MIEEFKDLPDALFRVAGPNFWSNTYTVKNDCKIYSNLLAILVASKTVNLQSTVNQELQL